MGYLLGGLIGIIIRCIYYLLIYSPVFSIAYFLTVLLNPYCGDTFLLQLFVFLGFSYLLYCIIYFLKGILISLKTRGNRWFIFVLIVCVLVTCWIPASFIQMLIFKYLVSGPIPYPVFWSLLVAAGIGFWIYPKYNFHKDGSPQITYWAYLAGYNVMIRLMNLSLGRRGRLD